VLHDAGVARWLDQALIVRMAPQPRRQSLHQRHSRFRQAQTPRGAFRSLDAETEEQLRALGYVH